MERFLWICVAGAAGTGARYLIAVWAAQRLGSTFPYGTLVVNLIGCFAIAALMIPILDEMVTGGAIVTVERVRVVRYAAAGNRG